MHSLLSDTNSIYFNGLTSSSEEISQALSFEMDNEKRSDVIEKLSFLQTIKRLEEPTLKPGKQRD